MQKSTAPAQYALILIDLVAEQGHSTEKMLAGTSLAVADLASMGARISDEDFIQLVSNAYLLTGEPALGLHLGLRLNLSAHAVLGQAFMTCRTLSDVLQLFLKYYHLLSPALSLEFHQEGDICVLTTVNTPREHTVEFPHEMMNAAFLNTLQGLLGQTGFQLRLDCPYPAPSYSDEYYAIFGPDVHFDSLRGRISFASSLLSVPLPQANPALRELYEGECARLLADLEGEESVAQQTVSLLRKFEGQYPQMPQLATMLNYSPRTYRRKLEAQGQSYQLLLDQVRGEHATRYLRHTQLPLTTIAYHMGFSDASNFRRAFTKWTGHSPSEVRNAQ